MDIYLAADHRGFELKKAMQSWLESEGAHTIIDLGASKYTATDDYPDYAILMAKKVAEKPLERLGIGFCGSGVGMMIAANKVKGIRASSHRDAEIAAVGRADDNTNVLILPTDYLDEKQAREVITAWLATEFQEEKRFVRRINKIAKYEAKRT